MEDKSGEENPPRTALLALYKQDGQTWLFPFIADRDLINQQTDNFYTFLKSTTLRAGKAPVRAIARKSAPPAPPSGGHEPTWEAPDHWERKPSTQMRIGNYTVSQ